jgi:hypothetical protein
MKRAVNVYKGLNSDTARDSISGGLYIDALDVRITTDTGESQGCITNIKGNKKYFTIPVSDPDLVVNGTPEIIGSTSIRNTIILFVADDGGQNGWIYSIEYSDDEQQLIGGLTLVYKNNSLQFKKEFPIEAVGRYENSNIQRVYWVDYNNYIRSLNIKDINMAALTPGLIDSFPSVKFEQPLLKNVLGGGSLLAGINQYAYRLTTVDGKQTLISPPGNLIHTTSESESALQSRSYTGDKKGTNSGKSLQITIDTSNYSHFDTIELIHILHEDLTGTPEVFSVETKGINGAASVTFIHTGTENTIVALDIAEYTVRNYPFVTAKSVAQKDNSLVVANIKGSNFDINDLIPDTESFDARVPRHNSTGALPNPVVGTPAQQEIAKLANAFNVDYNKDAHWEKNWHDNSQYKFQSNGTRLGGTGPNIEYNFHLQPYLIDNVASCEFPNNNHIGTVLVNLNDGYGNYANNTWENMASPFVSGLLKGYKRGETYRFGIVFYNKKGEASFTEFIGDIKFPDISDEDSVNNSSGTNYFPTSLETDSNLPVSVDTTAYALGIEFNIDFSTCPTLLNEIKSYQIVRVKRSIADTRRLCSGIMKVGMKFNITSNDGGGGAADDPANNGGYNLGGPNYSEDILHHFTYHQRRSNAADAPEFPGYGISGNFATINNNHILSNPFKVFGAYATFYSPDVSYNFNAVRNSIDQNSCLLMTGRYGQYFSNINSPVSTAGVEQLFTTNNVAEGSIKSFDIVYSAPATTENLGARMEDHRRKLRSVGQVDKDTSTKAIEYIKKWNELNVVDFSNSAQSDSVMSTELTTAWGPYLGYDDVGVSSNLYFRNFFTYLGNAGAGLNDHEASSPTQPHQTIFHKGATGITGSLSKIDVDPLTALPVTQTVTNHAFNTGTTVGSGPVRAVNQTFAPLNKGLIQENYTSTPIIDILLPKQEIYGGYTADILSGNIFQPASPIISVANLNPKVFGGDIFLHMFTFQESTAWLWDKFYQNALSNSNVKQEFNENRTSTLCFVVETAVNGELSYGADVKREVTFDVAGGSSGVNSTIWRQENNNSTTTWGKANTAGQKAMYKDVYNTVYSSENDDVSFFTKPPAFNSLGNVNDIRAYISQVKINSETVDSWTSFGVNDYYDVDDYGPINKIITWRDNVYYFQDKAVGAYSINPRAISSPGDGIPTELGSAKGFNDHTYLSTKYGSIHQWSVKDLESGIYYFDGTHKKIFRISGSSEPLSEMKGLHGLLKNFNGNISLRKENAGDNPILGAGVHTTRDRVNNEILFTFLGTWKASELNGNTLYSEGEIVTYGGANFIISTTYTSTNTSKEDVLVAELYQNSTVTTLLPDDKITLVFDELVNQFSSRYSATPPIYIENGDILLSADPSKHNEIYQHNKGNWGEFYGKTEEMSIKLVLNENADFNKILRTLEFNSIVRDNQKNIDRTKTITAFRVETEYQDTGKIDYDSGRIKRRFDKWRVHLPRDTKSPGQDRLRSTYFILTLYFDNTDNRELILDRILYYYDIQIF